MSMNGRSVISLVLILSMLGCTLGPKSVKIERRRYNESVETTNREEALLNIVRLRYEDTPGILNIAGITTQRSWVNSAGADGAVGPDAPKLMGFSGKSTWTERPTVTYSTGGRDQKMALYKPMSTETLFVLTLTGWSMQRLWTVAVENINGISNAHGASGPMPDAPPEYGQFQNLLSSMQSLHDSQGFEISRKPQLTPISGLVSLDSLDPVEIRLARESGYAYEMSKDGSTAVLNEVDSVTVIRFSEEAAQSQDGLIVYELLGLDQNLKEFELKIALGGRLSTEVEPHGERTEIFITPRSVLQVLFFLSKGTDLPECHLQYGVAPYTRDYDDHTFNWHPVVNCFRIKHSKKKPKTAAISVPYRGYWFYIDDCDTNSKRSMLLLDQILEAQLDIGGAENLPTLTLPL